MLDQDVYEYVISRFTPELADEILRGFENMVAMGYNNPDSPFINLLMGYEYAAEDMQDKFRQLHTQQLSDILKEHSLYILPTAKLTHINDVMSGVYLLQQLDDYSAIDSLLNSDMSDEDKLIEVLKYPTTLNEFDILNTLDIRDSLFIKALQYYTNEKMLSAIDVPMDNKDLIVNYKHFASFIGEQQATGVEMLRNGLKIGLPFENYIDYIDPISNTPQDALNLLSFLLMAENSYKFPLVTFRKYSSRFSDDLNTVSRIDAILTRMIGEFERYKLEQNNEKA